MLSLKVNQRSAVLIEFLWADSFPLIATEHEHRRISGIHLNINPLLPATLTLYSPSLSHLSGGEEVFCM